MSERKTFFPQKSCTHYRNEMQKHSCPEENKTSEKKRTAKTEKQPQTLKGDG